jgi:hypothetical protein
MYIYYWKVDVGEKQRESEDDTKTNYSDVSLQGTLSLSSSMCKHSEAMLEIARRWFWRSSVKQKYLRNVLGACRAGLVHFEPI